MKVRELAKVYDTLELEFDNKYIARLDEFWQSKEQYNDILEKYGDNEIDWIVPVYGIITVQMKKEV